MLSRGVSMLWVGFTFRGQDVGFGRCPRPAGRRIVPGHVFWALASADVRELGLPVPSINDGVTRADDFLSVKDGRPVCGRCPDWRRRRGEEALST